MDTEDSLEDIAVIIEGDVGVIEEGGFNSSLFGVECLGADLFIIDKLWHIDFKALGEEINSV